MEKITKCFSAFIAAMMFLSLLAVVPRTAEGWTGPVKLMPDPGPNKHRDYVKIAVDSEKHLHVVWREDTKVMPEGSRHYWEPRIKYGVWFAGTWTDVNVLGGPFAQGSAKPLSIELDANDDPHILFKGAVEGQDQSMKLWYSHRSGGRWDPLKEDVGLSWGGYNPYSLALDGLGQPHVFQTVYPGQAQYTQKSITEGEGWTDPRTISSDGYYGKIKIDSSDRIHFLWEDRTSDRDVVYRLEPDGNDVRLGLNTTTGGFFTSKTLGLDHQDNAIVAYSRRKRRNVEGDTPAYENTVEYRRIVDGALGPAQVVPTDLDDHCSTLVRDFVVDAAGNAHFLLSYNGCNNYNVDFYYTHVAPGGTRGPMELLRDDIPYSSYGNMVVGADPDHTVHIAYAKDDCLMYTNSSNDD